MQQVILIILTTPNEAHFYRDIKILTGPLMRNNKKQEKLKILTLKP